MKVEVELASGKIEVLCLIAIFLEGNLCLPVGGVIKVGLKRGVVLIDIRDGGLKLVCGTILSFGFSKSGSRALLKGVD